MDLSLEGKKALVCGSTQGIGRAAAVELGALGAAVTLIARNEEALRAVAATLPARHAQSHDFIVADFSEPALLKQAVEDYMRNHSEFHILVNNTGGPPPGDISEAKPEQFLAAFSQHLICNQILAQLLIDGMKRSGYGRIVNVVSTSVREPLRGLGVSNTVRGAVAGWAKTLAGEVGRFGVTVNNVLPGPTKTKRIDSLLSMKAEKSGRSIEDLINETVSHVPLGRFAEASEIGAVIAFLASPAAAYVSGVSLAVDGGRTSCI